MKRTPVRHISACAGMVFVLLLVLAVFATPALAVVTWSSQTPAPGAVIGVTNPTISVKAADPAGIAWYSRGMKLDGVRKTPTYNASTGVMSLATTGLTYGTHTVNFSVNNNSGQAYSTTWTFTISGKPVIGALSPADGSTTTTDLPAITAAINPVGTLSSWVMKVDGAEVTANWNSVAGVLSYTPTKKLRNDASHSVSVECTNSAGQGAAVAWSFTVQIYADMQDTAGCTDCHPAYPTAHPMTNCAACHGANSPIGGWWDAPDYAPHSSAVLGDCAGCHSSVYPTVPRHGDVSQLHLTVANMSGCACHVRSITIEHNRWTDEAGNALSCASCHGANASQRVKDALAAGSTNCLDCHDLPTGHPYGEVDHVADNGATPLAGTSFTCGDCHQTDLMSEHEKTSSSSAGGTCTTCHPMPRDSFDTWNDTCSQGGCHPSNTTTAMHGNEASAHTYADPNASCLQAGCHAGKADLAAMHSAASTETPAGGRTSCLVCHADGVPTTKICADCHPDRVAPHGYDEVMHTPLSATSLGCQVVGCHVSTDVGPLHANRPEGACAVCHANPTRGDLTAGKTSANCEGCHITSGVDYHKNMTAKHTAPVSDYEACGKCHHGWGSNPIKGEDITRHAGGCATCHNGTTVLTGKTAHCADCHKTEGAGTAPEAYHRNTVAKHSAQDIGSLDCARCHDTTNVRVLHANAPNACGTCHNTYTCLECHSMHNPDAGTALTRNVSCSNCHNTVGTNYHKNFTADHTYSAMDASCQQAGCHSSSLVTTHQSYVGTGNRYPQYSDTCALCHLNSDPNRVPANATAACSSCHTGNTHPIEKHTASGTCVSAGCHSTNVMTIHSTTGCSACHATGKTPSLECSTCHTGNVHPNANHTSTETCNECHSVSDISKIHGDNCATCHPTPASTLGTWDGTCSACHTTRHAFAAGHPGDHGEGDQCWDCHDGDSYCSSCHYYDGTAPTTTSDAKTSYVGRASVKLTATDVGTGVRTTFFQVDGGAIQTGSTAVVEAPATGTSTHTIEFWSMDRVGNTETHKTATFTTAHDGVAPVTTSDAKASYWRDAVIKLSATDNATSSGVKTTYYRFDNGAVQTGTTATLPFAVNSSHTIYFWSEDYAGNVEAEKSATFTFNEGDATPPTTTSSFNPATGANVAGPQAVTLSATDNSGGSGVDKTYYKIDAGAFTTGTSFTVSGDGLHTFSYYSVDSAGNTETVKASNQFRIDSLAPVSSTSAANGGTYYGAQTFTVSATDAGSGVASVRYQLDSGTGAWTTGTSVSVPAPSSGTVSHTLYLSAIDNAGNTENPPKAITFVVGASYTSGSIITATGAPLFLAVPAGVTQARVDLYGGGGSPQSGTIGGRGGYLAANLTVTPGQTLVVKVGKAASGLAGGWGGGTGGTGTNVSGGGGSTSVGVSGGAVLAEAGGGAGAGMGAGQAGGTWSTSATGGNANGGSGNWCGGGAGWTGGISDKYGAGAGTSRTSSGSYLTCTAGGNSTSWDGWAIVTWNVNDTQAPTGTMSVNSGAAYTGTTAVTVNSAVSDNVGVTQMSIDPGTGTYGSWIAYSASAAITLPAGTGTKTVRVQYRDAANNILTLSDSIVLDTTAPTGSMSVNNNAAYTNSTAVTVNSSVTDAASGISQMSIDPGTGTYGAWIAYAASSPITLSGADGTKTVRVQYRDSVGNILTLSDTIFLDATAPYTTANITPGQTYLGSQTFTLSPTDAGGSGVSGTWWQLDSTTGTWNTGTSVPVAAPASGTQAHTLYWYSKDTAGNTEVTKNVAFSVSYQPSSSYQMSYTIGGTAWVDAELGASGPHGTFAIYADGVLIGIKDATDGTSTWNCPGANVASGARIDIVQNVGWDSAYVYDQNTPITYSFYLPAGSTRLEAATWTGFPGIRYDYGYDGWDWGYPENDYEYVALDGGTITNIVYSGPADTTAPTGAISVSSGAAYTKTTAVTLALSATDAGSGVSQMRFSNDNSAWSAWETYATSKSWTLATGDGAKTVYVQYKDQAGNTSTSYSDGITLDGTGPSGTMSVNSGAAYTGTTAATVNASVSDGGSGMSQMSIDPGTGTYGSWVAYSASSAITLPSGSGTKTVRVQYRDVAGNVTTLTDTIVLDVSAPTGTMSVNGGAAYTNLVAATVNSSVGDALSGVTQMAVDPGTGTYGAWIGYAATYPITLTGTDGAKTIRVQYRDAVGNVLTLTDTIVMDATAPFTTVNITPGGTYTGNQTFALTPSDNGGSGVAGTWWSLDSATGPWTSGTSVAVAAPSSGTVSHNLYWYSRDIAGNQETTKTVQFAVTASAGLATLEFIWEPPYYGYADLRVIDSFGNTVASTSVDGYGTDLDWTVQVPAGQAYTMYCDYYYDDSYGEGGGYGFTTPVTQAGQTYTWGY